MSTGNVVTNNGRLIALNRIFKSAPDYTPITYFKFGTGTTTPAITDTDLETPIPLAISLPVDSCDSAATWTGNADATLTDNTTTYLEGTGSINMQKNGTASNICSMYKTTTSRDFTSNELIMFFYIKDATALAKLTTNACVRIRFGSDSTNYYEFYFDKADLVVGWNSLRNMTSATADAITGSPVVASTDYTYVEYYTNNTADTTAAGDFMLDNIFTAQSSDFIDTLDAGNPVLDETTYNATITTTIALTDLNGWDITEFGTFNNDATKKMATRSVFPEVSKTNSVILQVTEKFRVITT